MLLLSAIPCVSMIVSSTFVQCANLCKLCDVVNCVILMWFAAFVTNTNHAKLTNYRFIAVIKIMEISKDKCLRDRKRVQYLAQDGKKLKEFIAQGILD